MTDGLSTEVVRLTDVERESLDEVLRAYRHARWSRLRDGVNAAVERILTDRIPTYEKLREAGWATPADLAAARQNAGAFEVFDGDPTEMFGTPSADLTARYERTIAQIEEAERG